MSSELKSFRRVLFKLSGEALLGGRPHGIDVEAARLIARDIQNVMAKGVQLCLVIGGGNIFRGIAAAAHGMDRSTADHAGMLATVMNALALQSALEYVGVETRVQSAIPLTSICEPYVRRRAFRHMEKGRLVIFAAGTGNPFFTTDTAASLRASEMMCDALFKGTQVNGVYTRDPLKHKDAQRYDCLTYQEALTENLGVMDASALSLARDNNIPIVVFSIQEAGALENLLKGALPYTIIQSKESSRLSL